MCYAGMILTIYLICIWIFMKSVNLISAGWITYWKIGNMWEADQDKPYIDGPLDQDKPYIDGPFITGQG